MKLENPLDFSIEEIGNFSYCICYLLTFLSDTPIKLVKEPDNVEKQQNKKQKIQKKN